VITVGGTLQEPVTIRHAGVPHPAQVKAIALSPDGTCIASGSDDGSLRLWEVATGRLLSEVSISDPVNSVAFSPDGRRIATASGDRSGLQRLHAPAVRVWDTNSGKLVLAARPLRDRNPIGLLRSFESGFDVVFSRDGDRIASLQNTSEGPVIWDAHSGRQ